MAIAVAMSPGIFILLIFLQNILAQQCLNSVGYKNLPGFPQHNFQKSNCGFNQITQNGVNVKSPQQGNAQQVNYQQQSNIQQAPFTQQASNQPQLNLQQASQQPANSISNSQLLKQQNQELAANIFSALYNVQQSSQNQRGARNIVKGNSPQQTNYEQPPQNQLNPALTVSSPSNLQNNQPLTSSSYSENSQFQPSFSFQFVPVNNAPVQQNPQMIALPAQKGSTNDQSQSYLTQNQPVTNAMTSQQVTETQSPVVMIPGMSTTQNQPIVLTLQSPQTSVQKQPALTTSQTSQNQPIIYTIQTQPPGSNQIQQILEVPSLRQSVNNPTVDKQSLMTYVMSQMQSPQESRNGLASILPAMLNTKSEKSSSMKALLPLIFNILNERKGCCGCPHCGCNNGNNQQPRSEPIVNSGYSSQINYSQQKPDEVSEKMAGFVETNIANNDKQEKQKVDEVTNSAEMSEEEEDEEEVNDSDEDFDEE